MHPHLTTPYRQQLLDMRANLLERIAQLRGGDVSRAESAAVQLQQPEESRAQAATEREFAFAMDEHETQELAAIDAALQRLEQGTYGECTDCGVEIPAARLHAAPEAARCIQCQEAVEHKHP